MGQTMLSVFMIAICRRDLPAAMPVVATLIAGGLAKAGYAWWGIGVMAGLIVLAAGIELFLRDLETTPSPIRWHAR
jgi:bacteriorhodopsin